MSLLLLANDVLRLLYLEYLTPRDRIYVQLVIVLPGKVLDETLHIGWWDLTEPMQQRILQWLQTPPVLYRDLITLLRAQVDDRVYEWDDDTGWTAPWWFRIDGWTSPSSDSSSDLSSDYGFEPLDGGSTLNWIVFEIMHILPEITEDLIMHREQYPWLFQHARTCALVRCPTVVPPSVTTLTMHCPMPSFHQLWPSVETLVLYGNSFSESESQVRLRCFPKLGELHIQDIMTLHIMDWENVHLHTVHVIHTLAMPPDIHIPSLVRIHIQDARPEWTTYAMTLQAPVVEYLEVNFADLPSGVRMCPKIAQLVLHIGRWMRADHIERWHQWLSFCNCSHLRVIVENPEVYPPTVPMQWPKRLRTIEYEFWWGDDDVDNSWIAWLS